MKKIYLIIITLICSTSSVKAQDGLELLFQWSDESISDDNWVGCKYNEVWGIAQNGHEFAIIGSTQGTHIFDITNPENSNLAAYIEGADSSPAIVHRDFHDYNGYLYAVADEGESTLQIIDISSLPNEFNIVYDSDEYIKRAHNIFIDEQSAIMYVCGGRVLNEWNKLALFSIEEPQNPVFLSTFEDAGYIHDIYVKNDIGYLNAGENGLYIVDFSNPSNGQVIGSLTQYPDKGYNHSGWLNNSGETYIFADENHGYEMKICDVSNPSEITVNTTFLSNVDSESMAHNLIIKENYVYVSHYHDGLFIWDISDPSNPILAGSFDTYLPEDHDSYRGAWGVYPLLPSGNILVSDMQSGLFVLSPLEDQNSSTNVLEKKLSVFPNPFSDEIKISFSNSNDEIKLEIFDVNGRSIIKKNIINESTISELKLSSGFYFLHFEIDDELLVKKLIKQ
ncbi:MAG: choice-of-anchor B family protein [Bacteroidota bacterium]|nr:choice-of-anchor B family protein [Bacteroidota bacterium]